MSSPTAAPAGSHLPSEKDFQAHLSSRHRRGRLWKTFYLISILIAILALVTLFANVINETFGTIAVINDVDPETLTEGRPLSELTGGELAIILQENVPQKLRVLIRDNLSVVDSSLFTVLPLEDVLKGRIFPGELGKELINDLSEDEQTLLLTLNLSDAQLEQLVLEEVVKQEVVDSWPLFDTVFNYGLIEAEAAAEYPEAELEFRSWLNDDFISQPMSSIPANAGVRTALLGTLYMMLIVIVVALPLGVGAAIYLEEYATDNLLNRILETNIRNLAGVPSIIYGMLGLAVFVRALEGLTSGAMFGVEDSNGRTILSASLTLALLILPIIIINAQEAVRAVPSSLREASYGLGATQWQTIWRSVLPASIPGILTGTILAISRAVGETAPLIVVGASTFIVLDPDSPFSKFTALPIQIFQWTSRPQDQFRDIAAAAILILLVLMLSLNATAIFLRNRYSRRY